MVPACRQMRSEPSTLDRDVAFLTAFFYAPPGKRSTQPRRRTEEVSLTTVLDRPVPA
jgi:hypothetical protein